MDSPCIKICSINEKGYCAGCKRNIEEIANWMFYSREERQKISDSLERRKI
ncbi:DUF1289 domain-containing protein [Hyphobacterium sp. CCMP332]|nr:DUF1289 domain-containing protein [Hyphobacterium sp. CCMP332]